MSVRTCNQVDQRYPGQYYDQETGLHYNSFRDYDPKTGRYIEPDPIGLSGGMNPFVYANNNSIVLTDPKGLAPVGSDDWNAGQKPVDLACGRRVAAQVFRASLALGLPGTQRDNTPWNAYLHCVWNCEMLRQCGWATAVAAGHGHEIWDDGRIPYAKDRSSSSKDLHNNSVGRGCAETSQCGSGGTAQNCSQCCLGKLNAGALRY